MHLYCLLTTAKKKNKHFLDFYLCRVTSSILVWQFLLLQFLWKLSLKLLSNFVDVYTAHSWEQRVIGVNKNLKWLPEQARPVLCWACFHLLPLYRLTSASKGCFLPSSASVGHVFCIYTAFPWCTLSFVSLSLAIAVPSPPTCVWSQVACEPSRGTWDLSCSCSDVVCVCVPGPESFSDPEPCMWELGWAVSCQSLAL